MKAQAILPAALLVIGFSAPAPAAAPQPREETPVLRLQAGGPTSQITALAFGPDGQTLYAAGLDKVVHVWTRDGRSGKWEEGPAFRVPIGPGDSGALNALALSGDGVWLAAAGAGLFRSRTGFRQEGMVLPAQVMSDAMRQDRGVIYVFNTRTRAVRVLRGHRGIVVALAFAPAQGKDPPPLVSAARAWDRTARKYQGTVWLWDTARGRHRAWPGPLPDPALNARRPGLAVWRSKGQADDLRVALAWGDGQLRLWDAAAGRVVRKSDARYNFTLAYQGGADRLLTGGYRGANGYLQAWDADPTRELETLSIVPADLDPQTAHLPLALTLVSSRPGGPVDHAAVVLRLQNGTRRQTRLQLLDLTGRRFGRVSADLPLWKLDESLPVVASSPGGAYLAVAGGEGHQIWIYPVKNLLAGNEPRPVRLTGAGTTFRYVAFARRQGRRGVVLDEGRRRKAGGRPLAVGEDDLVFDFARPGLTTGKGWDLDTPDPGGWTVEHYPVEASPKPPRHVFEIRRDGERVGRVQLKPGQVVTDFALLPPRPPRKVPVLAVAYHEAGEPYLALYDGEAGTPFRFYGGHEGVIRALAFSGDGRLLASVAEDQTVCLWSLTDLDKILQKHGLVAGLALADGNEGVVVARVAPDSPAYQKLEPGDVVEALLLPGGGRKRLTSAASYYTAVWDLKPGAVVGLQVKDKGAVPLRVGQGIDERMPLLSLFLTRPDDAGRRRWLGWSPFGLFESSDRDAEAYLGWHINTGRPEAPAVFAGAAKYRDRYYRKGVLKQLVEKCNVALVDRRAAPDLAPPKVAVLVGGVALDPARADARGKIPLQTAERTLRVAVSEYPRQEIGAVEWRLDGGAWKEFQSAVGREWSAELPPEQWGRGVHRIGVRVRTRQGRRRDFPEERLVRYQPPPPAITIDRPPARVVKDPDFRLAGRVRAALPGQEVEVRIVLNRKAPRLLAPGKAEVPIKELLPLERDENLIEIVAINKGALKGYEDRETTRLTLEVVYNPVQPQIVFEVVRPLPAGDPLEVKPDQPVRVAVPRVRVRGSVIAGENLLLARRGDQNLAGFKAGKGKTFSFTEDVALQPGPQRLAFRVKTRNTEKEKVLVLEYRPLLPLVEFQPPGAPLVFYDEGKGAPEVSLKFRLTPRSAEQVPFTTAVLVNGETLPPKQVVLGEKARELTVSFTPRTRGSKVQVRLTAPHSDPENSEEIDVEYLRPPRDIAFLNPPARSEEPVLDLVARVHSPLPLLPEAVEATVNGRRILTTRVEREKADSWLVYLNGVSLDDVKNKENVVRLWVSNEEGRCRRPGECKIVYVGKPPKRPEVAILAPGNTNVTVPEVTLQFRVASETALKRISVVNKESFAGQELDVSRLGPNPGELKLSLRLVSRAPGAPLDVSKLPVNREGFRTGELALGLVPEHNHLYVEAVNEGGAGLSEVIVVNYLPPPVRIALDRIELVGQGKFLSADMLPGGKLARPVAEPRIRVYGRVVWGRAKDDRLAAAEWVRVRVNGFQQAPAVRLEKPDADHPRERAFRLEVLLNQPRDNRLDFDLPGLEQEDGSRGTLLVDCDRPARLARYLHLLIVGVGDKDEDRLKGRIFKTLRAKPADRRTFTLPGFERGQLYGPLVGDVTWAKLYQQLMLMKTQVELLSKAGPSSHVVLVYFQGGEKIDARGHFLRTGSRQADPNLSFYRIPCEELEAKLSDTLGAKILLLDVQREPADAGPRRDRDRDLVVNWPLGSYVAVLRYAELGKPGLMREDRLLQAWEQALARVNRLKDVSDQVGLLSRRFNELLVKERKALVYDRSIPRDLWDLVIRPKS